jgi:hypothetical protein
LVNPITVLPSINNSVIFVNYKNDDMKFLVEIPDKQAFFRMEVLKSLSFVRKAHPVSTATARLWEGLRESAQEVQLHKQGKFKLQTAVDLLNEL